MGNGRIWEAGDTRTVTKTHRCACGKALRVYQRETKKFTFRIFYFEAGTTKIHKLRGAHFIVGPYVEGGKQTTLDEPRKA